MTNPEHVGWLLEGVDAWNRRRQETIFTPDLSRLNVREEFERERKVHSDGRVFLNNINFSGANLFNIDLSHARLCDANLSNANLMLANLTVRYSKAAISDPLTLPLQKYAVQTYAGRA